MTLLEEKVLKRLEELGQQMDSVAAGQRFVEAFVKRIYPDLNSGLPNTFGVAASSPVAGAVPTERASVRTSLPPFVGKTRSDVRANVTPRGSFADGERGFWPRKEWVMVHFRDNKTSIVKSSPNSTIKVRQTTSLQPSPDWIPVHPDSWGRAFFDFISMLVLLYDSILIPYQLAWPQPFRGWLAIVSWATFAFWCVDLVMGFFTGYHAKEGVVLDLRLISKRYLGSAFFPNLCVLIADCLGNVQFLAQSDSGTNGSGRTQTLIRLLRFIKLQRIVRLASSFRTGKVALARDWLATVLRQRGLHEQFQITARICKLIFYIIWVNHLGGCLWQMIGKDAIQNWYLANNIENLEDPRMEGVFGYALGFYFSSTAMIGGSAIMNPSTAGELLATVFYIVLGFILSSVIISSLLATVMEYQDANKERNYKLNSLRQFLYQHNIDARIAVPIVNQVHERMWRKKRLAEGDVEALSLISPIMRSELWYHIYGPHITANPFLCTCNAIKRGLIKDICFRALRHSSHKPGTLVFEPGMEAVGAHFVCQGSLDYVCSHIYATQSSDDGTGDFQPRRSPSQDHIKAVAAEGIWISEVAFWVHWLHRGWLDARTPCELMTVESEKFVEVLSSMPELARVIPSYASCVVKALEQDQELTDLSSLPHHNIVAAMPLDSRVLLSQAAIDVLQNRAQWSGRLWQQQSVRELKDEVQAGACDLHLVKEEVVRVVTVVALRLSRSDGNILARIGKITKGQVAPCCELPGTKVKTGEYPKTAIERLLREKLSVFDECVELGPQTTDETNKVSKTYGLKSRYMRVVFEADLTEEPEDSIMYLNVGSSPRNKGRAPPVALSTSTHISNAMTRLASTFKSEISTSPENQAFIFLGGDAKADTTVVFAWLRPEDFRILASPAGEDRLLQWLQHLNVNEQPCHQPSSPAAVLVEELELDPVPCRHTARVSV